jgi:hypothetical protein
MGRADLGGGEKIPLDSLITDPEGGLGRADFGGPDGEFGSLELGGGFGSAEAGGRELVAEGGCGNADLGGGDIIPLASAVLTTEGGAGS